MENEDIGPKLDLDIPSVRNFIDHMKSKEYIGDLNSLLTLLNEEALDVIEQHYFKEKLPNNTKINRKKTHK